MATNDTLTRSGTTVTSNASWEKEITQQNQTVNYHFPTAQKYVDQDIDLKVTAKSGNYSLSTSGTKTYKPTIKTVTNTTDAAGTGAASKPKNIVAANAQSTTKPTSGYFIAVKSDANTGTLNPTASVTTGWISSADEAAAVTSATVGAAASDETYITIPSATTGTTNSGTNVSTITANTSTQYINITEGYTPARKWTINPLSQVTQATITTATSLPSGKTDSAGTGKIVLSSDGYLKITAGYVPSDLYYSLAGLVPDDATITASTSSPYILSGQTAYDKDGKLITGGIGNLAPSTTYFTKTAGTTAGTGLSDAKVSKEFYVNEDWYVKQGSLVLGGSAPSIKISSTNATNKAGITMSNTTTDPGTGIYFQTGGSATPTRGAVTYTGTAGWIDASSTATQLGAASDGSATNLSTNTYYITKITVPKDKVFALETTADTVLDSTSNVTITNNAFRQLVVTNNANGDVNVTNKGQVDITSGATAASGSAQVSGTDNVTIDAYDTATSTAKSGAKTVVQNGVWKTTAVAAANTMYYGRVYAAAASAPLDNGTTLSSVTGSQGTGSVDTSTWKYNIPISITGANIAFKAKGGSTSGFITSATTGSSTVSKTGLNVSVGNATVDVYSGGFTYE